MPRAILAIMMLSTSRRMSSTSCSGRCSSIPNPLPGLGMNVTRLCMSAVGGMHCSSERSMMWRSMR